jgi:hypothetical protein
MQMLNGMLRRIKHAVGRALSLAREWACFAEVSQNAGTRPPAVRMCRACGCTDDRACIGEDGEPCYWVAEDLCSACAMEAAI